jgi:hypothetical protein
VKLEEKKLELNYLKIIVEVALEEVEIDIVEIMNQMINQGI